MVQGKEMQKFNQYIGIPFKPKGRDRNGLDCWGLLCLIYQEQFGIELPDYSEEYEEDLDGQVIAGIVEEEISSWTEIPKGQERLGDGVLLRIEGEPMHVGMVLRKGMMIHIMRGIDSVTENYRSRIWKRRVLGIYRYLSQSTQRTQRDL